VLAGTRTHGVIDKLMTKLGLGKHGMFGEHVTHARHDERDRAGCGVQCPAYWLEEHGAEHVFWDLVDVASADLRMPVVYERAHLHSVSGHENSERKINSTKRMTAGLSEVTLCTSCFHGSKARSVSAEYGPLAISSVAEGAPGLGLYSLAFNGGGYTKLRQPSRHVIHAY
jgi:hypothetical protein